MPNLSTTATLLKKLRVQQNLTQIQLGTRVGVTKASISAYEKGKAYPSIPILTKLAREFDVSIDDLRLGETPAALGPVVFPPLRTFAYLAGPERARFVQHLTTHGVGPACEHLARQYVLDVPATPEFAAALLVEVADGSMAPTLPPGARVLATLVPEPEWPYLPSGLYCVVYRATFTIKRLKDNTLLEKGLLLLHADTPLGGAHPVRGEDLRAVWQVRWGVYVPLE